MDVRGYYVRLVPVHVGCVSIGQTEARSVMWNTISVILTLVAAGVAFYLMQDARKIWRRVFASNAQVMAQLKVISESDAHINGTVLLEQKQMIETLRADLEEREQHVETLTADRDKWVNAEASAVSAHIAMGAELVDAKQQIERLTAELALAQQHAENRGGTVLAQERERATLIAGSKELAARNAELERLNVKLERANAALRANLGGISEGISNKDRGRE